MNSACPPDAASRHGRNYCVGVKTGTDALTIGIRLLGLDPGKRIVTTPFSWIASTSSIILAGCTPVYADIGDDLQIDLKHVEQLLREYSDVGAVLVPHLHGNVSSLSQLKYLRSHYKVRIIEDCAQAFAAHDQDGRLAGTIGDIAAFSFNPMKVLGALGDAGATLLDDEEQLARSRALRHSGLLGTKGIAKELATNCRIDAIQASMLKIRLKYFEEKRLRRVEIFNAYKAMLPEEVRVITRSGSASNHYCFQMICEWRDDLIQYLQSLGVEARVRHEYLIPDHPVFRSNFGSYPKAKELVGKTLCLPMHHHLSNEQIAFVADAVTRFYKGANK